MAAPPDIADVLNSLDAEAREWLKQQRLPFTIFVYENGGFAFNRPSQRHRVLLCAAIADPAAVDLTARQALRIVMAYRRSQHARKANDMEEAERWRRDWVSYLIAMPLSADTDPKAESNNEDSRPAGALVLRKAPRRSPTKRSTGQINWNEIWVWATNRREAGPLPKKRAAFSAEWAQEIKNRYGVEKVDHGDLSRYTAALYDGERDRPKRKR